MNVKWARMLVIGLLVAGVVGCGGKEKTRGSSEEDRGDGSARPGVIDTSGMLPVQREAIIATWKGALREISKGIDQFNADVAKDDTVDPEIKKIMTDLSVKLTAAKAKLDLAEKAPAASWGQAQAAASEAMTQMQTAFAEAGQKFAAWQAKNMPKIEVPETPEAPME